MTAILAIMVGAALGSFVYGIFHRALPPFEPPACYVCGAPGPMGELVPKLSCCAPCRETVSLEVERILDPTAGLLAERRPNTAKPRGRNAIEQHAREHVRVSRDALTAQHLTAEIVALQALWDSFDLDDARRGPLQVLLSSPGQDAAYEDVVAQFNLPPSRHVQQLVAALEAQRKRR